MGTKMKAFTLAFLSILSGVLAYERCKFQFEINMSKRTSLFSHGSVSMILMIDQGNCSINVDEIYEQIFREIVEENYNNTKAVIELYFISDLNTTINFFSNKANVSENRKVDVALTLAVCDVYLEDFEVFENYGNIVLIVHDNKSVIRFPNNVKCPWSKHVRGITSRVSCDAGHFKQFFWEACEDVFEKVDFLQLSGCFDDHNRLESDTLVHSFPNVQSLELENTDLAGQITFPWRHSHFDSSKYGEGQFLSELSGTTSSNNAKLPSIRIYKSSQVTGLLHFSGKITDIVLNKVQLKEIQGHIFANVTGVQRLDLSQNNLTEIDELLFKYLFELREIRLKHNKLKNLPMRLFENQSNLIYLDISHNHLTSVDRNLLRNLRFLQELHLEYNQLKLLPRFFLKEQKYSLKYLYLYSNPIITLPEMPFYGTNIELIDLHNSEITGNSIQNLTARLNFYDITHRKVFIDNTKDQVKMTYTSSRQRPKLDLSSSNIKTLRFDFTENVQNLLFLQLIESFDVNIDDNPISCHCDLYPIIEMVKLQIVKGVYIRWKCKSPEERRWRFLASFTKHDLICQVNLPDCPSICTCYERLDNSSFIVDCRDTNMSVLPMKVPKKYPLELWLKNVSLSVIDTRDYIANVSILDISNNKLTSIPPKFAIQLKNVNTLRLGNNNLTSLPVQIRYMNISKMYLDGNALLCDCHTRWMLDWLLLDQCPVINWTFLKCTDNNKHLKNIIQVPDSMFVCKKNILPSLAIHVIFPAIVIGSTLLVIVVLSLVIYFQRFTVKVLLYIIFGFRGFTDKPKKRHDSKYDCTIIYIKGDQDFVENSIVTNLLDMGYRVADTYKHSVIGFTFFEGIRDLIVTSRRVIFCMTGDTFDNELMTTLWNYSYSRAVKNDIASLVLITDDKFKVECKDENIKGYLKNGRYINVSSRLFLKRIEYMMPARNKRETRDHWGTNNCPEYEISLQDMTNMKLKTSARKPDIYILFPDELRDFIRRGLIPFLLKKKQNVRVLEDDFIYGNDITEIIHEKLDGVKHVIFILSNQTLHTLQTDSYEGTQLGYILPIILNKAFVCHHNYLLLFTYGVIDVDNVPKDLRKYVNTYITASVNDINFKERLLEALTYARKNIDSDEEDVKPSDTCVDTEAVSLI